MWDPVEGTGSGIAEVNIKTANSMGIVKIATQNVNRQEYASD